MWDAEGGEEVEDGGYAVLGETLLLFVAVGIHGGCGRR